MSKLSILLAHYDDDGSMQNYLDACLRSLGAQTFRDFELVLVSSGKYKPTVTIQGHHHSEERLHFPAAIKKAYELSDKSSEYIMLLNNDTVLHKDCLQVMMNTMKAFDQEVILNPLCNSDSHGFFYHAVTGSVINGTLKQYQYQHSYEDMKDDIDNIINHSFVYPLAIIRLDFAPFYATIMKRSTYDKVGGIDERYLTNRDDYDFSLRARKFGIKCFAALHAFVFHFGGRTTSKTKTEAEEKFNNDLFFKKHGIMP